MSVSAVVVALSASVIVGGFVLLNVRLGKDGRWFPHYRPLQNSLFGGLSGQSVGILDRALQVMAFIGLGAVGMIAFQSFKGASLNELAMPSVVMATGFSAGYLFQYRRDKRR